MSQTFYITTAIDYVNAAPHLGHAYEKIAADVAARFHRMLGDSVFFLTGTDEHGIKVEKTAKEKNLQPKAYADSISQTFVAAWAHLNLSYDRFIRTTDTDHYRLVEALWRKLIGKGDIYKASYTGLYCAGCENFLNQRDVNEAGECLIHQVKPEPVAEENYFFRLSRYREAITAHIQANPTFIQPEFRAAEVLHLLESVEDISVSRSVKSVTWGIPVPDDPEQRIYVWIDALSNYLTGLGYLEQPEQFERFWPCDVHLIGKDILRFHAIYWPAMLMAAEIPLPKMVYAHGFITVNESKISKSLGNVISPFALSERFDLPHADPVRYYLMTCTSFGNDGNFSEEDFKLRVNADLANNLGNLLNRTLNMTIKYFEGRVPDAKAPVSLISPAQRDAIAQAYQSFAFHTACELILERVDEANKLINESEPWNLFKSGDLATLANVMTGILDALSEVALMLAPVTPTLAEAIWSQLGYTSVIADQRWTTLTQPIPAGQLLNLQGPILPRLESEIVGAAGKK